MKLRHKSATPATSMVKQKGIKLTKGESISSSHSNDVNDGGGDEPLWKRNVNDQLQYNNITYIDNYGRMNNLFDEDPAITAASGYQNGKLTNVIKRLTSNAAEEKKKEDDAWRIAESIINDVCSVTIDNNNPDNRVLS